MFSFHKPRIYRSASGCCICRAKSSSSRFTDSRRYEGDFYACFKLGECRTGDICNACVLLVKRWKKLPKGSQRNWHHVVDARAGHGSKPISKINKVKKPTGGLSVIAKVKQPGVEFSDKMRNVMKKHISPSESYISSLGRAREHSPSGCSDDVQMDCISSESGSYHSSLAASPTPSEVGDDDVSFSNSSRNKKVKASSDSAHNHPHQHGTSNAGSNKASRGKEATHKSRRVSDASHSSFLDLSFWKREKTCCGIIFKGPCGEVLLDRRFLSPCFLRAVKDNRACTHSDNKPKPVQRPLKSETSVTGTEMEGNCQEGARKDVAIPVDCISVDSGYDESSNSNPAEAFKPQQIGGVIKGGCIVVAGKVIDAESLPTAYIHESKTLSSPTVTSSTADGQQPAGGVVVPQVTAMDSSPVASTIVCAVPTVISQN